MRTTEVVVKRCTFNEEVRLSSLKNFPTVIFIACKFKKGFCAREARVENSLKFIDCDFGKPGDNQTDIALNFENAHIGGELFFYNCRIGGRVFASGMLVESDVRLRGCQVYVDHQGIGKPLRFDQIGSDDILGLLKSQGWALTTSFGAFPAVTFEGAEIKGDLEITSAPLETTPTSTIMQALITAKNAESATAAVVAGSINAVALSVHGRILLFGTLCLGNVDLKNCRCNQNVTLFCAGASAQSFIHFRARGFFDLYNASLEADVDLRMSKIEGWLTMQGAQIRGSITLFKSVIHGVIFLYRASIKGNVDVLGVTIFGNLDCTFAEIGGLWAYQRLEGALKLTSDHTLEVRGDLILSGAQIENVHLRGILVKGRVDIITGKFGAFVLAHGLKPVADGVAEFRAVPSRAGAVRMSAITVTETLSVAGLQVTVPDGWYWENHVKDRQDHGFTLEQSIIGRDLLVFTPKLERGLEQRIGWPDLKKQLMSASQQFERTSTKFPWAEETNNAVCSTSIWGGLILQANQIGGNLDLRSVRVEGPIYLNDTSIGLDLRMDGFLEEARNGALAQEPLSTTCLHLNAEKLNCGGDVDFSGLRVLREMNLAVQEIPGLDRRKHGVLLAHGAQVTGQITFLPKERNKRQPHEAELVDGYAFIDGVSEDPPTLDLTAVKANHLLLSGSNVPHENAKVSLERAHFARLEIVNPPPGPIDLSRTAVDRWVVGDKDDPEAKDYEAVLKRMQPFDRLTWIAVETSLRNQAQDGDANRIYREMRWKARRTRWGIERFGKFTGGVLLLISLLVLTLMCLTGVPAAIVIGGAITLGALLLIVDKDGLYGILGFGTFAWVPIIVAVLLFPLTVFVFAHPQNVRASSDMLQVLETGNSAPILEVTPTDMKTYGSEMNWGVADALALTLRYQIPIMPSLTHTGWEASRNRVPFLFGMTAQHYALGLTIYHWIAWPLFLVWITARVVRGRQT